MVQPFDPELWPGTPQPDPDLYPQPGADPGFFPDPVIPDQQIYPPTPEYDPSLVPIPFTE